MVSDVTKYLEINRGERYMKHVNNDYKEALG